MIVLMDITLRWHRRSSACFECPSRPEDLARQSSICQDKVTQDLRQNSVFCGSGALLASLGMHWGHPRKPKLSLSGQSQAQDAPKRRPRGSKLSPSWTQEAPKRLQVEAKRRWGGPRRAPKRANRCPKTAKMVAKSPPSRLKERESRFSENHRFS